MGVKRGELFEGVKGGEERDRRIHTDAYGRYFFNVLTYWFLVGAS